MAIGSENEQAPRGHAVPNLLVVLAIVIATTGATGLGWATVLLDQWPLTAAGAMKVTTVFLISIACVGIAGWIVARASSIAPARPKPDPVPRWWHAVSFAAGVPICALRGWEGLTSGRVGTGLFWGCFFALCLVMAIWEAADFRREGEFSWPSGRDRPDGIVMLLFPFALAWEVEPSQARLWAVVAGLVAAVALIAAMAAGRRSPPTQ